MRKNFRFLDPLPPCHCHKSADFVPFVCFVGSPLPPPTADVIYGSPQSTRVFYFSARACPARNATTATVSRTTTARAAAAKSNCPIKLRQLGRRTDGLKQCKCLFQSSATPLVANSLSHPYRVTCRLLRHSRPRRPCHGQMNKVTEIETAESTSRIFPRIQANTVICGCSDTFLTV